MAYLAGAGTVVTAIAAGIGGGLVIGNIMSPQAPKQEMSKLERRGSAEAPPSTKDPLVPVPYLAATQGASNSPVVVSPSPQNTQADAGNATPQTTQAAAPAPSPQPSEVTASNDQSAKSDRSAKPDQSAKPPDGSKPEASKSEAPKVSDAPVSKSTAPTAQPAIREQASTADDSYAKARDADLKRAAERRKAERRSQWTDRRRYPPSREQELRDVEESVREDTGTRVYEQRPTRLEYPQVRFFDVE
jgi:hypothetical protein